MTTLCAVMIALSVGACAYLLAMQIKRDIERQRRLKEHESGKDPF